MEALKKQRKLNPEAENQTKPMEEEKEIDQRVSYLLLSLLKLSRSSSSSRISKEWN